MGLSIPVSKGVDKKECIDYARNLLDMINTTYRVSNFGKEIRFTSKKNDTEVKLYPTTGTHIYNGNTYKTNNRFSMDDIKFHIKDCIKYHINENL